MSDQQASMFGRISVHDFLDRYWQQAHFVVNGFLQPKSIEISGDDLAGLACEVDVDSRMVFCTGAHENWRCEFGPFDPQMFESLPEADWSLLVQGVEQYNASVKAILSKFSFLPQWRLDDIMISYATKGGGVGPHFDQYDVFLIQLAGTRSWHIGDRCDDATELLKHDQLKLLKSFNHAHAVQVQPGDLLYVPAGISHQGIATSDDCITISVGFRAPSLKELSLLAVEELTTTMREDNRYRDSLSSIDLHPNRINDSAIEQVLRMFGSIENSQWVGAYTKAFGRLVTEQRIVQDQHYTSDNSDEVRNQIAEKTSFVVSLSDRSRFAFMEDQLFVDGDCYEVGAQFCGQLLNEKFTAELTTHEVDVLVALIVQGRVHLPT